MSVTGGVRLQKMIRDGKISEPWLWIDCYNQAVKPQTVGTIHCGVDFRNGSFISTPPTDGTIVITTKKKSV